METDDKSTVHCDFNEAATMVRNQLEMSVGVRVKCAHLESEAGQLINGLEGTVVAVGTREECAAAINGGPPFRVDVRIDGVADVKKLRMLNLLRQNYRSGEPGEATVPTSKARDMVAAALKSQKNGEVDLAQRPDTRDRLQAAKTWCEAAEQEVNEAGVRGEGARPKSSIVARCGMLGRPAPGYPCIEAVRLVLAFVGGFSRRATKTRHGYDLTGLHSRTVSAT